MNCFTFLALMSSGALVSSLTFSSCCQTISHNNSVEEYISWGAMFTDVLQKLKTASSYRVQHYVSYTKAHCFHTLKI